MTPFHLDDFLPYQLSVLANRISRDFAAIYGDRFGLTIPEWRVLAHLNSADQDLERGKDGRTTDGPSGISVREVHARVDMDKSKVTRAAQRLEAAGLIEKTGNPADRRLVTLALSARGRAMMAEITPLALAFEAEILASIDPDKRDVFRAVLTGLLKG